MNYPDTIAEHVQRLTPSEQKEALDFVLFLEQRAGKCPPDSAPEQRRAQLAEALRNLQAANPFKDIPDPVAWQREIRQDRPLPGRD